MTDINYVYVRTPVFREAYKDTYMLQIVSDKNYRDKWHGKKCKESVLTADEFLKFCKETRFFSATVFACTQNEYDFFTEAMSLSDVEMFEPHLLQKAGINMATTARLKNTREIFLFELARIEKLWDTRENTALKLLHILNCNRLHDFSELEGSNIETLKLFGCNGLSSFTSMLHVDDLSFVLKMPKLKSLHLEIVKDKPAEYYIKIIEQLKNLEEFMSPESFLTFEQFAYLAAKLPNCKGLEPSLYCKFTDTYSIIGYRKPRFVKERERVKKYEQKYFDLIKKYKDSTEPPV